MNVYFDFTSDVWVNGLVCVVMVILVVVIVGVILFLWGGGVTLWVLYVYKA